MCLASAPSADRHSWPPVLSVYVKVAALNVGLNHDAAQTGSTCANPWSVLADGQGFARAGLVSDHVQRSHAGDDVIEPGARRTIADTLAKRLPVPLQGLR